MTQIATRLARLRTRIAETGTDLLALGPGAHMHWLAGFTPHADERPCLMLIGTDNAGFLRAGCVQSVSYPAALKKL